MSVTESNGNCITTEVKHLHILLNNESLPKWGKRPSKYDSSRIPMILLLQPHQFPETVKITLIS